MTDAQPTADRLTTVQITDEQNRRALEFAPDCQVFPKMAARQIVYLTDQLTDLRASLAREENARKNAVSEHDRMKAQLREYQSAHANLLLKVKNCPNCDAGANHE